MAGIRAMLTRPLKLLEPLRGAGTAFLQWPTRPQVLMIALGAFVLFGALGVAAFVSFRWHGAAAARIPPGLAILARLDQAAEEQRSARKQGQEFVLRGRDDAQDEQLQGLRRLGALLAALKPLVAGSGDVAASVERLTSACARQAHLAELVARLRQARPAGHGPGSAAPATGFDTAVAESEENYSRLADLFQEARGGQKALLDDWDQQSRTAQGALVACLLLGDLLALAFIGGTVRSMTYYIGREDQASGSLRHIQSFMNCTSEAVYGIDLEGRCTFCNRALLRLLGQDAASQLLGRRMQPIVFGDNGEDGGPVLAALRLGKGAHLPDAVVRTVEGAAVVVECRSSPVYEDDVLVGAAVTLVDLSGPKAAQAALERDHAALALQVHDLSQHSREMALFGQLAELLQACTSTGELCQVVALSAQELFPDVAGALYVLDPLDKVLAQQLAWGDMGPAQTGPFPLQDCWSIRRGKPHYQERSHQDIYCSHVSRPGPSFTLCLPLGDQVGSHGMLHFRAVAPGQVLSERRQQVAVALAYQVALGLSNLRLKEILREEAIHDPVTGLFNRRFMKESLAHEVLRSRRDKSSVGLISFDLDHFKGVNDTLGHAAGDAMLQAVANLARQSVRDADLCCRQGGDEFLVILLGITEADALKVAEGLRAGTERLSRELFPGLAQLVTMSAGVAVAPQDAATAEGLQKAADRALYRAKGLGRNQVFAASALDAAARAA